MITLLTQELTPVREKGDGEHDYGTSLTQELTREKGGGEHDYGTSLTQELTLEKGGGEHDYIIYPGADTGEGRW